MMIFAGFWRRLLSALIDVIVVFLGVGGILLLYILLTYLLTGTGIEDSFKAGSSSRSITPLITLLFTWIYSAGMESSDKQATIGKLLLQMKVTDLEGNQINLGRATIRFLLKPLFLFIFINFIIVLFTKQKQMLHDIFSGCLVINKLNYTNDLDDIKESDVSEDSDVQIIRLENDEYECSECGSLVNNKNKFCPQCGNKLNG